MSDNLSFFNYTIDNYLNDINVHGFEKLWKIILEDMLKNNKKFYSDVLNVDNFGELYEIGLAFLDKTKKKHDGKYYTPVDVSLVMGEWFDKLPGINICDVGCGTGNLILNYFNYIGKSKTRKIINDGSLYLYDMDGLALRICRYAIAIKYGEDLLNKINIIEGDFLDKKVKLPDDCKVISNPPYYKIDRILKKWGESKIICDTKEFYAAFMEKIISNSVSSVIISPYSFLGGEKFYSLRLLLNKYNGFIVSFDNVPGNIFCGKKHGIFNSNNSNSVRAAITVVENKSDQFGFRLSPLIRFKSEERNLLLKCDVLETFINSKYQHINMENKKFYKCFKELEDFYSIWKLKANKRLRDIISEEETEFEICIPNTCRYFTTGSSKNLNRSGKIVLYAKNQDDYNYIYCLANSSFLYWHWRLFDGGINFPRNLLLDCPVFIDLAKEKSRLELNKIVSEMKKNESKYMIYKKNASKIQENIKFPQMYRDRINRVFFDILGIEGSIGLLNLIHSNSIFDLNERSDIDEKG